MIVVIVGPHLRVHSHFSHPSIFTFDTSPLLLLREENPIWLMQFLWSNIENWYPVPHRWQWLKIFWRNIYIHTHNTLSKGNFFKYNKHLSRELINHQKSLVSWFGIQRSNEYNLASLKKRQLNVWAWAWLVKFSFLEGKSHLTIWTWALSNTSDCFRICDSSSETFSWREY